MKYLIKDEHGETMRIVGRQEEALIICALRAGWTFKCLRKPIKRIDLSQFEDALI
jgi:galactose-1-phosphate uridylyltransferase